MRWSCSSCGRHLAGRKRRRRVAVAVAGVADHVEHVPRRGSVDRRQLGCQVREEREQHALVVQRVERRQRVVRVHDPTRKRTAKYRKVSELLNHIPQSIGVTLDDPIWSANDDEEAVDWDIATPSQHLCYPELPAMRVEDQRRELPLPGVRLLPEMPRLRAQRLDPVAWVVLHFDPGVLGTHAAAVDLQQCPQYHALREHLLLLALTPLIEGREMEFHGGFRAEHEEGLDVALEATTLRRAHAQCDLRIFEAAAPSVPATVAVGANPWRPGPLVQVPALLAVAAPVEHGERGRRGRRRVPHPGRRCWGSTPSGHAERRRTTLKASRLLALAVAPRARAPAPRGAPLGGTRAPPPVLGVGAPLASLGGRAIVTRPVALRRWRHQRRQRRLCAGRRRRRWRRRRDAYRRRCLAHERVEALPVRRELVVLWFGAIAAALLGRRRGRGALLLFRGVLGVAGLAAVGGGRLGLRAVAAAWAWPTPSTGRPL
mmetsp:Transcript_11033/g.31231  ORF Transcript_11033/g.31231 Transcript_11033/m.31231 type:complete len:486 (+) Transcript_11033:541-1998(+)